MKTSKKSFEDYQEIPNIIILDWKEISGEALEEIDTVLKNFKLEIEMFDDGSDNFVFRIIKRNKA